MTSRYQQPTPANMPPVAPATGLALADDNVAAHQFDLVTSNLIESSKIKTAIPCIGVQAAGPVEAVKYFD